LRSRKASGVPFAGWLTGVPHNPDPGAPVEGIDGTSWYSKALDRVSGRLKISSDTSIKNQGGFAINMHFLLTLVERALASHLNSTTLEFHCLDPNNIFSKHPTGSRLADNAEHFRPEIAVISRASSPPSNRVRLARKSPCKEGDSAVSGSVEGVDVRMDGSFTSRARPTVPSQPLRFVRRGRPLRVMWKVSSSEMIPPMASVACGVGHSTGWRT
jgi:hypothetical protein